MRQCGANQSQTNWSRSPLEQGTGCHSNRKCQSPWLSTVDREPGDEGAVTAGAVLDCYILHMSASSGTYSPTRQTRTTCSWPVAPLLLNQDALYVWNENTTRCMKLGHCFVAFHNNSVLDYQFVPDGKYMAAPKVEMSAACSCRVLSSAVWAINISKPEG